MQLGFGIGISRGQSIGASISLAYDVTVASGAVSSNITSFQMQVNLAEMPATFWDGVSSDGGNIRVFAADGTTQVPHDVASIDTAARRGRLFFTTDITTAGGKVAEIQVNSGDAALAPTDPFGRNAVWSDYEFVMAGGTTTNRTGNAFSLTSTPLTAEEVPIQTTSISAGVVADQGVAISEDGQFFIYISNNALWRASVDDPTTIINSNLDPIGDSGIPTVDHLGDGVIIGEELFVPLQAYPANTDMNITVYDATTLAYKRTYDISANGHFTAGIGYDGTSLYVVEFLGTAGTSVYRYNLTGVLQQTITLDVGLVGMQSIEHMGGDKFWIGASGSGGFFEYTDNGDGTWTQVRNVAFLSNLQGITRTRDGRHEWISAKAGVLARIRRFSDFVQFNDTFASIVIDPASTVWSYGAEIQSLRADGDGQYALINYSNAADSVSARGVLYLDDGPDDIGLWNGSSKLSSGFNPRPYQPYIINAISNGTARRAFWINGALEATSPNTANDQPNLDGTAATLYLNKPDPTLNIGQYGFTWLRHDIPSDAFMQAIHNNLASSNFYKVSEAV